MVPCERWRPAWRVALPMGADAVRYDGAEEHKEGSYDAQKITGIAFQDTLVDYTP